MPKYKRFEYFIYKGDEVDLTESEFKNAKIAKAGIMEALFIEELLDMVLKNFTEFEETIYSLSLKSIMHLNGGWKTHIDHILLVNRRLINLLTTCRMYVDHIPQKLRNIYGDAHPIINEFKKATNREYDSSLGYRFCYALRNFTQHSNLPVDALYFDTDWLEDPKRCEHRIAVQTTIGELDGTDFKKTLLDELKTLYKDKIDIKPLVRQNVVSIGNLNKLVRDRVDPDVDRWEQWIKDVVTKSEHGTFPVLAQFDDNDQLIEEVRVSTDWAERLRMLLRKNMSTTHYHLHYISGDAAAPTSG